MRTTEEGGARTRGKKVFLFLLAIVGALAVTTVGSARVDSGGASAVLAAAASPDHVSFTLEGCRNDGTIALPNGSGQFICPDGAYTSGNLGKGWNELDLVPYRLTSDAGNAAPATQTFTIAVVLDNFDAGDPGYDVISAPVLNTALSDASCTAATVGPQSTESPGVGGIDTSIYRLVTITQAKNTECVYDYYGRLALGSHLFSGSSLHANLTDETLDTGGIGARDVSIPVKEILPQELSKTMTAQQDTDHAWQLAKEPSPAHLDFGNTCDPAQPSELALDISITWTKGPATPVGQIQVDTYITAKNPAARTITVNVTDNIRSGNTVLDTASSGDVDVPANTQMIVFHHSFLAPSGTTDLNDVATATYTDKVTGIPVPGSTQATASAAVQTGSELNATASVTDSESISGAGLDFKVASPSVGSFSNYTADTFTTGPVDWSSGSQSDSGSVTFNKTVRISGPQSTTGNLVDTATLTTSGAVESNASVDVDIQSSALGSLTINKTIPNVLQNAETATFTFHVKNANDVEVAAPSITFGAGETSKSVTVSGLALGSYTVSEDPAAGWAEQDDASASVSAPSCEGSVSFTNRVNLANARVKKVTDPAGFEGNWEFKLYKDSTLLETVTTSNANYVDFASKLGEGSYSIVETAQDGWLSDGGSAGCSFTIDLPADAGNVYSCAFKNTYQPRVMLDKSGDVLSKVGDEVEYTIKLSNTSSAGGAAGAPSLVCDVSDAKIGFSETVTLAPGGSKEWKPTFTIPSGAADPYPNTASANCHYPGLSDVVASSQDDHSINLFQPSVKVEKSASNAYSKAGDKVTYTVKITNESSDDAPPLELASFTDSLVNGVTPDSSCDELGYGEDCSFTYDYTVQDGDDDPLPNTATALYHPEGFPNDITDSGSASVDLLHPSYTINKVCTSSQPVSQNAGSASFQVRINNTGDADLVITADDGIGTINLAAGGHYSKSVSVAGPFAGQASVSNTVSTTSVTLHEQYNLSNILDNQSSTASCQVGGLAKVKKTVSGAAPSGTQAFTFTLREGASVTSQGTTLQTLIANAGNGGNLAFSTNLVPGNHYQLCEDVMPGWNTTLGPNLFVPESLIPPALPNPNVNNMTVCTDFVAAAGGTEEKVVDNSPPPGGRALTIGFWKNWASCASSNGKGQKPMLDLALGLASKNTTNPPGGLVVSAQNPGSLWPNYAATWFMVLKGNPASTEQNILPAADCAKAVNLLNKSTADGRKKMASDPLFNMTAQLVAAQLNRFMGAGISGITIMNIDKAVLLNGKYKFDGLTYTPKLTAADTTLANCLATQLDNYNNNRPVSAC